MPKEVFIKSRNQTLVFPDEATQEQINDSVTAMFPPTGKDMADYVEGVKNAAMEGQDLVDPFQQMSDDNYVLFKQYQADKKTSPGEFFGIAKDTFNQVRDELATGIGTAAYKTYQGEGAEVAKSLGEGMTAGMVGTYDILNKIFDPAQPIPRKEDFVGKVAKPDYASNAFMGMGGMSPNAVGQGRVNTEEDYKNLIASEKQRDSEIVNRLYAMESTMRNASIPEVARGGQFVDPFLAAGLGGALVKVALKGGKTLVTRAAANAAAKAAARTAGAEGVETAAETAARTAAQGADNIPSPVVSETIESGGMTDFVPDPNAPTVAFPSTAPSPMAQAGLRAIEGTAGAVQGVASLPSRALQAVGRIAESVAPGSGVGAQATALTASAMGDLGLTAGVVGGAKATEKVAEVVGAAARIAQQEASRLGGLERVALDESVSQAGRKFAAGLAQFQPLGRAVVDVTKGAVKGAAAGSVVGGALGGLAERNLEGVAAGFGAGGALGGLTGSLSGAFDLGKEALGGSTSRTRQQATGDLNTFITTRPEIEQGAWSDTMSKLVAKVGPERAASQLDAMRVAEASGGKLRVATPDEIKQGLAPGWVNIDGMEIVLNPEKIRGDTAAHESAHILFNSVINRAFRPEIEAAIYGVADPVTGQIVKAGVFDDVALGKVAEQIRDAYGKNTIAANEFQGFANTLKNSTDADSLANARSRIADEMTAAYTGRLFERTRAGRFNPDRLPLVYRKVLSAIEDGVLDKFRSVMFEKGMDLGFDNVAKTFKDKNGKPIRIPELDAIVKKAFAQKLKTVDVTNAKPDLIPVNPADRALWAKTYGGAKGVLNDNGTPKSQSQIDAEAAARWQDMTSRLSALPDSEKIGIDFSRDKAGKTVMTAKGQLSPTALTAILDSGALDPSAKAVLVEVLNSMQRADKSTFDTRYYGVYTRGKGGNKMVAGVKSASQNEILPYSVEINSKDGVLIRAVDMSKVRDRLATAMTKPEFKAAFDSPAEALKGFRKYMDNITQINAVDSATLLGGGVKGATRRNLFYDALGFRLRNGETLLNAPQSVVNKSQNTIKSYRAERFAKLVDSGNKFAFEEATTYERGMRNFQPDAFTPESLPNGESFTNPDGFRILNKTGSKLFRTYDDTGKLIGIADSKEKAMRKAQSEFATQASKQKKLNEGIIDTDLNKVIPVKGEKDVVILTPESMKRFQPVGDVSLDELHGKFAMVIPADRMRRGRFNVGPIGSEREASVIAQGGPSFIEEHPNAAWAWTTKAKADGTLARARAQAKPGEKDFLLAVTLQGQEASLSNKTTQRAYKDALEAAVDSKLVSRKDMDAFIEEIYGEVHNLTKGSKDKENQTPAIRSLNELLKTPEFAIKPGGVLRDVLLKKRTNSIIPFVEQEKLGIAATQLAQQANDPRFTNLPNGTIVALVQIPLDAQPKRTGFHYSYDWEIQGKPIGYLKDPISASGLIGDYQSVVFPGNKFSSHIALGTQPRLVGLDAYIEQSGIKRSNTDAPDIRFQPVTPEQFNNKLEELQTLDLEDDQFVMPKFNAAKDKLVDTIADEAHLMVRGKDTISPFGAHELFIVDDNDAPIGFVRLTKSPEQISINMIQIDENYRGRGIGSEFYRYWLDKGVSIKSDKEITEGTAAIYQKLAREGYRMDIQDNRAVLLPKSNDIRFQPDPTSPNILNGSDGSRIIKSTSGKYRVYLATGALAGVKDSLESAQKLVQSKSK